MILAAMPTTTATPRMTSTSFTRTRSAKWTAPVKFKNHHLRWWCRLNDGKTRGVEKRKIASGGLRVGIAQ
jgi:hypothetical protein